MFPRKTVTKDGRSVTIRRVRVDDAVATLNYINQVCEQTDYLSFGPGEFGRSTAQQTEHLERITSSDRDVYLLAVINNQIVGMINFGTGKRPRTRHTGDFGLSVHKDYWGIGLGSTLLQCLVDWAHDSEVRKINLRVRTDNKAAIRLYERKGFRVEGTISRETFIDGHFFDSLCMGLDINPTR